MKLKPILLLTCLAIVPTLASAIDDVDQSDSEAGVATGPPVTSLVV